MTATIDHSPLPPLPATLAGRTILQIIPQLDAGGAERTTIDIAAALAEAGARPLVASVGGRLVSELQSRGGVWIPFPAKTKNPFAMGLNVGRLARLAREEGVDLIHARSRAPAWSALAATRRLGLPFVTTYHGVYNGTLPPKVFYNSVMARGDVVIANSAFTAERIAALHPVAAGRVRIIHRGCDLRRFDPANVAPERVAALRRAWGAQAGQRIIFLPGRLTNWKGQRVFIDAARRLAAEFDDLRFVMAGDAQGRDRYVAELHQQIADAGLSETAMVAPHCEDMPAALLAAAAVAVPSTDPEAFGRVPVEAQAMGAPVVASNHGATRETILAPPVVAESGRTGWLTAPGDADALAEALAAALALGASARARMAQAARAHVEANFSLERMISDTLAVYDGLLGQKSAI